MNLREEFENRKDEIEVYFEILRLIELDRPKLVAFDFIENKEESIIFDNKKINIVRASTCLLIYNLIESTVYNSVCTIFDDINSSIHNPKLKYFDLIDQIKKYWIQNVWKNDETMKEESIQSKFLELSNRIFNDSLVLASNTIKNGGSLDAKKIRETLESLGIDTRIIARDYDANRQGEVFKQIKNHRNWLAHGQKSFDEIGRDYPYQKLETWKKYVIEHLEKYILSVEDYICNQRYKITNI